MCIRDRRKRTQEFIGTFLRQYREGGQLPVWELAGNFTGCMIGYHSVSVIADAYLKGIRGFDEGLALEAMRHSAEQDHLGLEAYKKEDSLVVKMNRKAFLRHWNTPMTIGASRKWPKKWIRSIPTNDTVNEHSPIRICLIQNRILFGLEETVVGIALFIRPK